MRRLKYAPYLLIIGGFGILMKQDWLTVIWWWLVLEAIGLVFYPVTQALFKQTQEDGFFASKTIGLTLISVSSFAITTFFHMRLSLGLVLGVCTIVIALACYTKQYRFKKQQGVDFASQALLFLCILFVAVWIRGLAPRISDLEKYMDFGLINTILRADAMPPMDMWYAGETVNYYYFGHFTTALLTRLTGIAPEITYNLMVSTLISLAILLVGGVVIIAYRAVRPKETKTSIIAGVLSSLMTCTAGSLHTVIYAIILPKLNQWGLYRPEAELKAYWFSNATRYIGYNPETNDKTIHEFPLYSFIVSDLHAHYIDILFVLTYLVVLLLYYLQPVRNEQKKISIGIHDAMLGVLLGAMLMTNAWDFPIYALLLILTYVLKWIQGERTWQHIGKMIWQGLRIAMVAILVASPMLLYFKNFSHGVGWTLAHSPIYQLFVLWGYQFVIGLLFLFVIGIPSWIKAKRKHIQRDGLSMDAWMLACFGLAVFLIVLPEIIYIIDITGEEYHRANTMFKFTYQAFILFGVVGGYMTVRLFRKENHPWIGRIGAVIGTFFIALACLYPYYAVSDRYGSLLPENYDGLDGLVYLEEKESLKDYYSTIEWMNKEIKRQPVIIEADGYSFTENGIVSMATGLPTPLGWYQHEWLWRGTHTGCNERSEEVKTFYTTKIEEEAWTVIKKYDIQYIIVGPQEREKFEEINETLLNTLGMKVFSTGDVYVIQTNRY